LIAKIVAILQSYFVAFPKDNTVSPHRTTYSNDVRLSSQASGSLANFGTFADSSVTLPVDRSAYVEIPDYVSPDHTPTSGLPELLSPVEAAQTLGVTEADVMTVLESGELKGRKIGSTWRIPRTAITSYMS
jgi:excisionase family DNA binding protein